MEPTYGSFPMKSELEECNSDDSREDGLTSPLLCEAGGSNDGGEVAALVLSSNHTNRVESSESCHNKYPESLQASVKRQGLMKRTIPDFLALSETKLLRLDDEYIHNDGYGRI